MARSRNIKPGFFKNDILAELDPLTRLLFIGLWCIADREGRLENRPKRIQAEILPYDNCDIEEQINALAEKEFIAKYEVDGNKYINIVNWQKHQNPHHMEVSSDIPAPPDSKPSKKRGRPVKKSSTSRAQVVDTSTTYADSLNLIPDSLQPDSLIDNTPHAKIQHLTITKSEHAKLTEQFGEIAVIKIYESMANYGKLRQYKSGYLTAKKWLERDKPKGNLTPTDSYDDAELILRRMQRAAAGKGRE